MAAPLPQPKLLLLLCVGAVVSNVSASVLHVATPLLFFVAAREFWSQALGIEARQCSYFLVEASTWPGKECMALWVRSLAHFESKRSLKLQPIRHKVSHTLNSKPPSRTQQSQQYPPPSALSHGLDDAISTYSAAARAYPMILSSESPEP